MRVGNYCYVSVIEMKCKHIPAPLQALSTAENAPLPIARDASLVLTVWVGRDIEIRHGLRSRPQRKAANHFHFGWSWPGENECCRTSKGHKTEVTPHSISHTHSALKRSRQSPLDFYVTHSLFRRANFLLHIHKSARMNPE